MLPASDSTINAMPRTVTGAKPVALADIYQPDVNLVRWQRKLDPAITHCIDSVMARLVCSLRLVVDADISERALGRGLGLSSDSPLVADIRQLVVMFADLFVLRSVGLRFERIDKTMCPRFHTDHLMCRLVTTYRGNGTQWLTEANADRSKLGPAAAGVTDALSGIYRDESAICSASAGEVLLLKGEDWPDNGTPGIIHRSPPADPQAPRLLLTLDMAGQSMS